MPEILVDMYPFVLRRNACSSCSYMERLPLCMSPCCNSIYRLASGIVHPYTRTVVPWLFGVALLEIANCLVAQNQTTHTPATCTRGRRIMSRSGIHAESGHWYQKLYWMIDKYYFCTMGPDPDLNRRASCSYLPLVYSYPALERLLKFFEAEGEKDKIRITTEE